MHCRSWETAGPAQLAQESKEAKPKSVLPNKQRLREVTKPCQELAKLKFDPDPSFLFSASSLNKEKCKIRAQSVSVGCPETERSVLSEVNGEGLW